MAMRPLTDPLFHSPDLFDFLWAATYRTRSIKVQARRVTQPESVWTPLGVRRAKAGDWIVRNPDGTLHVLKDAAFKAQYQRIPSNPFARALQIVSAAVLDFAAKSTMVLSDLAAIVADDLATLARFIRHLGDPL